MIRFIGIVIVLLGYLIFFIPVLIFEWILGRFNPEARDRHSLKLVQGVFKIMLKITGVDLVVIGEELVPDEPVLFIGNHRSFFDILITYSRCKNLTGYIAKKEMEKLPLLSTWMKRVYCLFLDRTNPKEGLKTILKAIEYVKKGISICIFPEGTRNTGEELSVLPFKDGSLKIAEKTGCAIVPMSLNNTAEIFENHLPSIRKTRVVLEYGAPIYPKELDAQTRKHLGAYCQKIIQDTIIKNATLLSNKKER